MGNGTSPDQGNGTASTGEGATMYVGPGYTATGQPSEMSREEFQKLVAEHTEVKAVGGTYAKDGTRIVVSVGGKLVIVQQLGSDGEPVTGEERYGVNWNEFDQLTGRLLTLCDATFTDPVQRKAFKDMVRSHIKEWVAAVVQDAAYDAGEDRSVTAPFYGVALDTAGLWGIEGEPTS